MTFNKASLHVLSCHLFGSFGESFWISGLMSQIEINDPENKLNSKFC